MDVIETLKSRISQLDNEMKPALASIKAMQDEKERIKRAINALTSHTKKEPQGRTFWTPEKLRLMGSLKEEGKTARQIAEALETTIFSVYGANKYLKKAA